jgi:hypothetical protein
LENAKQWLVPATFNNTLIASYYGSDEQSHIKYAPDTNPSSVSTKVGLLSYERYSVLQNNGIDVSTAEQKPWYFMNPIHWEYDTSSWYMTAMDKDQYGHSFEPNSTGFDVRPVIHLKEGFAISGGSGTEFDPYTLTDPATAIPADFP